MAIRYDKKFNNEINKIVRAYNSKINRLSKKDENYVLPDTIEDLRAYVHSELSTVDGIIKEGIVFRSQDGSMSFKCVDPEYLIKYHQ